MNILLGHFAEMEINFQIWPLEESCHKYLFLLAWCQCAKTTKFVLSLFDQYHLKNNNQICWEKQSLYRLKFHEARITNRKVWTRREIRRFAIISRSSPGLWRRSDALIYIGNIWKTESQFPISNISNAYPFPWDFIFLRQGICEICMCILIIDAYNQYL